GIWSEKQIDTIRVDEPLVGLGGLVPLRLIVIDDELYPFASLAGDFQTTTRVHLFAPQGVSLRLRGRRRGERSGLPDRITDADWPREVETSAVDTVSPATNSLRFIMALLRRRR